jgi:hypothetical protein
MGHVETSPFLGITEFVIGDQRITDTHLPSLCAGEKCIFHNPTKHKMRNWPIVLRSSGLIERQCKHGVGHPDPDSVAWKERWAAEHQPGSVGTWDIHGCDGCCQVCPSCNHDPHVAPRCNVTVEPKLFGGWIPCGCTWPDPYSTGNVDVGDKRIGGSKDAIFIGLALPEDRRQV